VELDRKMLADLAIHEPEHFAALCARAADARAAV
jgi:ribosomal protein L20